MSNIQSYNALIDRFKAFASGHFILKRFSHGQIEVSDLEKFGEYPFMHVVPSNVTYAKGMKTFSFQIVLADMPRDKEEKPEYQREVLSDLQRIAEDLVAEITNHRVLFGDLITVNNVSLEPFLEEFQHTLTGWTISLDLLVPYYWDACSIPAEWNDMFESSTGGTGSILTFIDSITRDNNGNVSLVNDEAEPSPNYYYGTNDEGVRGWYLLDTGGGLTCETIGDCQTIIDIEAAIDALEEEILLKANTADISAVGFSNDYNDLDNKPTIPSIDGLVPYEGATQDLDLGTNELYVNKVFLLDEPNDNYGSIHYTDGNFHIEDGDGDKLLVVEDGFMQIHLTDTIQSNLFTTSLTQTRDHYLPNQSGTIALTSDIPAAQIQSDWTQANNAALDFIKNKPTIPSIAGLVPETRTLTINGTTQDLSANRTFTIATGLTVGTTPITSGTVGRVLFEGTGNVLQQSANLFWDNTNSRLGIGTASPSQALSVQNGAIIGNASFGAGLVTTFDGTWINLVRQGITTIIASGSGGNAGIGTLGNAPFTFLSNGLERLRIFAGGNIAIGTTTDAGFKLDVNGTARITGTGTTAATNAFTVRNSGAVQTFNVNDLGQVQIGRTTSINWTFSSNSLTSSQYAFIFSSNGSILTTGAGNGGVFGNNDGGKIADSGISTAQVASAVLEANSTTRGFLPPRMTTTQKNAIASPASGLVVYDTTLGKLCVRGAAAWETITSI
jgi:hypothetical protein